MVEYSDEIWVLYKQYSKTTIYILLIKNARVGQVPVRLCRVS